MNLGRSGMIFVGASDYVIFQALFDCLHFLFTPLAEPAPTSRPEDSEKLRHFQAQDGESDEDLALAISLSLQPLPPAEKAQPPPNRWARRSRSARDESS